ncbi:MAG: endolytic transglycosylase MltG [Tissierellia bacterium]|nr:endolytic transglycosylase MltG [Tissierellia bacterium]
MNSVINKIIDFFATVVSKLSVLLIILVLGLIIFSRIDKLFKMDLIGETISNPERLITANVPEEEAKVDSGPAKIVYEGDIKPEDSASAINAENINPDDLSIIGFEIFEGQSVTEIANTLRDKKLIQDPDTFVKLLESSNLLDRIIPGVYKVPENIKNMELIESITIPPEEGVVAETEMINFEIKPEDTPNDVAKTLLDKGFIQDPPSFIMLLESNGLMESIVPGIYKLPKDIINVELIKTITTPH